MNSMFNRFAEFPQTHVTITPSDANDLNRAMIIYCGSAGDIAVHDKNGTAVTYTVAQGDILPLLVLRVLSTGTTVTQVIGIY